MDHIYQEHNEISDFTIGQGYGKIINPGFFDTDGHNLCKFISDHNHLIIPIAVEYFQDRGYTFVKNPQNNGYRFTNKQPKVKTNSDNDLMDTVVEVADFALSMTSPLSAAKYVIKKLND